MKKILFILFSLLLSQFCGAQTTGTQVNESNDANARCAALAKDVSFFKGKLVRNAEIKRSRVVLSKQETYDLMNCYDGKMALSYRRFSNMQNIGKGMIIGGGACCVGALFYVFLTTPSDDSDDDSNDNSNDHKTAAWISLGGGGLVCVGVPVLVLGNRAKKDKLKEFSRIYLDGTADSEITKQSTDCYLSFKSSKKGLGLALTF